MGSIQEHPQLVYNTKLSSVGPGHVSGQNMEYDPTEMDLAMKLHYIRAVYFFPAESVTGMAVREFKEAAFIWLDYYYEACGRFRRRSDGRPYLKCNDCGVRFLEGKSDLTLEQWVDMVRKDHPSCEGEAHRLLVPNQVIGPELTFSPQVLLQLTFLKCGGISLGMRWAHILGDAFSATQCMNAWAKILSGNKPTHSPNYNKFKPKQSSINTQNSTLSPHPLSVKTTVDPVGDLWLAPTTASKMETLSFRLTSHKLEQIMTKVNSVGRVFDAVCAVMWNSIAKTRETHELKRVTVVRGGEEYDEIRSRSDGEDLLGNTQVAVGVVEVEVPTMDPAYLAELLRDGGVDDERLRIAEMVGKEGGNVDVVVYGGANLTFVDYYTVVDWYGFQLRGKKPVFVNCFVDGVGEEGVVLVMPGNQNGDEVMVNVTLPESQVTKLKQQLADEWCISGL